MAQLIVSEGTLAKARHLGNEMARDPVVRPHIEGVLQYQTYNRFRIAHRAYWEQATRWERYYQERVFSLADREAARYRVYNYDSITNWDVWYNRIVQPIKNAIWETWEKHMNMEARYFEALLNTGRASPAQVMSIIGTTSADEDEIHEQEAPIPAPIVSQERPTVGMTVMRMFGFARRTA